MNTKKIIQAAISTLLISLSLAGVARAADISSQAGVISVTANQRTLTQVMMKNYLLSALGVRARKADEALQQAAQQFTVQQQQLSGVAAADLQAQVASMSQNWQQVRQQYQRKANKQNFNELYSANNALLRQADLLLDKALQTKADGSAQPLTLVGQQELLCQQLVVIYAMTAWGVASATDLSYDTISADLRTNMAELQGLPQNTAEINAQLQQLSTSLEQALSVAKARPGALLPALVDRSVVKVIMQLEQLQSAYLSLADA
ncbi:hypothetical protein [Amphritea sp.]|uniref:hypothetical protein n=1 Tax=Amphritea sp. TaxID=1872502 RepID=UPI003D12C371